MKTILPSPVSASSSAPSRSALMAGFAAIYLIWGSTYLGIRVAVETIPPFLMAGVRFLVAGAIMITFIAVTRGFHATRKQWRTNAIVGAFLCLGGNGLVAWAEQKVPSGIATLIISASPVFIVLLDWVAFLFFKDGKRGTKPRALTFVGLALGFVGLIVLVGPDVMTTGVGTLDPWSVFGLVAATFFWGCGMIYMKYAEGPAEPFIASSIQMLTGGGWLLLTSLVSGEIFRFDPAAVAGRSVLAWCYLVTFGSLIGFSTFTWLMKHSTPAKVSTYAYVNPVVAVFLGWLILHEQVNSRIFVAAAIIIAGVGVITVTKNQKPKTVLAPPTPDPVAQTPSR